MSAGTIALTNNSANVTGTGTAFTTDLKAGDFVVVIVGGVTYTLGVKAITSATALTLVTAYGGPTATGNTWTAVPNATLVGITAQLAADVAKAIRGLNLDKANWQQVYSGTGNITVTLPDGSTYTGPAWSSITTSLSGKAAKGVNNDITSLTGLTTAITIAQGGTGATTAATARNALGAAPLVSPTFTGNVQVDQNGNNPAGPTGVSWSLYLISATATGIAINTNVDTTDSAQRQIMRVQSIGGRKVFLEVNGGIRCRQGVDAIGANPNNAFNINWATTSAQLWIDGSNVGNISLGSPSDFLLKKEVVYKSEDEGFAESCLDEVMGWKIASFKYKSRGVVPESDTKLGFIANQLITKSPECVTGKGLSEGYDELNPDNPYMLDNVAMIAKLTGALHAQQHQIDELKKQIASLQDSSAATS